MDTFKKLADYSRRYVNLAETRLGAQAIHASDDFFAAKERMLDSNEPVLIADKFDDHGKWMDGWESRRRRDKGHDYCVIRLAKPGSIAAIDVDTRFFTGNYPPEVSVDVCNSNDDALDEIQWQEVLTNSTLQGDSHNLFEISDERIWSHLRLNIYPDGGIARLRVYGDIFCDWSIVEPDELIDLAALTNGGRTLECNNEHFGAMRNLLMPGRGANMGDGWETRQRRQPGHDWVIIKLGHAGIIKKVEIDTAHFKGNFPDRVSINAACLPDDDDENFAARSLHWQLLLAEQKLEMDKQQYFEQELTELGPVTHLRVNIHPDGGLSRVRVFAYTYNG